MGKSNAERNTKKKREVDASQEFQRWSSSMSSHLGVLGLTMSRHESFYEALKESVYISIFVGKDRSEIQ